MIKKLHLNDPSIKCYHYRDPPLQENYAHTYSQSQIYKQYNTSYQVFSAVQELHTDTLLFSASWLG